MLCNAIHAEGMDVRIVKIVDGILMMIILMGGGVLIHHAADH